MGTTCTLPPPSLLVWVLHTCKVPSGQFSSPIKLSLSGHCYLSEPMVPPFDQSMRYPDLDQITPLLLPLPWSGCCMQNFLAQRLRAYFGANFPWLQAAVPNKSSAFHTSQLSDQTRDHLGQGPSWPKSSPFSRCHLAPQFLCCCPSW